LFTASRVDILDNSSLKIQYSRNRYYDYYTGRFTTHYPLGINPVGAGRNSFSITGQYRDGLSLYEYAGSNPATNVDAWGLKKCKYDSFALVSTLKTPVDETPSSIDSVKAMISFISRLSALASLCPSGSWAISAPWGVATAGVPGAYCNAGPSAHMKFCGYDAYILVCDWFCAKGWPEEKEVGEEYFSGCAWYKCPKYEGICPKVGECEQKLIDLIFDKKTKFHVFDYDDLKKIGDTEWPVETWLSDD